MSGVGNVLTWLVWVAANLGGMLLLFLLLKYYPKEKTVECLVLKQK